MAEDNDTIIERERIIVIIKQKIRDTHHLINEMKSMYECRPSRTRERTYLQYRKAIKILEETITLIIGKEKSNV